MRIHLEVDVNDLGWAHTLVTLARLAELYDKGKAADLMGEDVTFYQTHLPRALIDILGALQVLVTQYQWSDEDAVSLTAGEDWRAVLRWATNELGVMAELAKQADACLAAKQKEGGA